jgi:hypothetical protein
MCVNQKSINILLVTPLGKKDQVAKTVQSDLSQMGARCELDMNNIVTASLEDLSLEEQQKFKALQEYMQVQFLAGVEKDRSGKVASLKEFDLPAIRLNDNNIEVIPNVSKKPPCDTTTKSIVGSDELLASYIARLERLEDLEKDRALGFNYNDTNISTPKANPQRSHPSLAPLLVNNDNFAYGLTPNPASGHQYPQFQPHRPNMATLVGPMQGTGQTGAMELVPDQPL